MQTKVTHQLRSLPAGVVCKKAETFIAVTLQEDHTGRRTTIPGQVGINKAWDQGEMEYNLMFCNAYLVAVAMHMALASPISGHLVAWSNQFPNCLIGSKDTSWFSSKHWKRNEHSLCVCTDPACWRYEAVSGSTRNYGKKSPKTLHYPAAHKQPHHQHATAGTRNISYNLSMIHGLRATGYLWG